MARKKNVPDAAATAADSEPPELEHAMEELALIVNQLEVGNGSLEESLRQYERGIKLLRSCHQKLDATAHRIEVLSSGLSPEEPIRTRSFDGRSTLSQAASGQGSSDDEESEDQNGPAGSGGNLF